MGVSLLLRRLRGVRRHDAGEHHLEHIVHRPRVAHPDAARRHTTVARGPRGPRRGADQALGSDNAACVNFGALSAAGRRDSWARRRRGLAAVLDAWAGARAGRGATPAVDQSVPRSAATCTVAARDEVGLPASRLSTTSARSAVESQGCSRVRPPAAGWTQLRLIEQDLQMTTSDGPDARRIAATRMHLSNVTRRQPCSTARARR